MADDKKNIPEAAPPAEAPAPAVENAAVPEQPAPEPALTDAEAVMLEHEGQAALFEMGEAVPDPSDAVTHAEVEEPAAPDTPKAEKEQAQPPDPGKDNPTPAHSGKVVDFAAARDEAAKDEKKEVKQKPPTEKDKAAKPGRGRPPKEGKAAPDKAKPPKPRDKKSQSKPAPEKPAVDKGGAPTGAEVTPEPSAPRDATRAEKEEIVYLNLSDLHPFKNHPFGVRDDAEMQGLVESVKAAGVNQPALVRPREDPRELYQRGVERKRVELIAAHFNEYVANEPKVSFRNGQFIVTDGQHTIEGRILRNGGKDLPILCKVYTGMTVEQEALLFAEQNGFSAPLTAGIKLRAKVVGGDAISKAFLAATNRVGLSLNYDSQQLTDYRIGCVGTAFRLYKQMGEPLYCETMRLIVAAWEGNPDSFRASVLKGMMHFVELYHGEFSEERLLRALRSIHPVDIYRIGQDDPAKLRGWKKYVFPIYTAYNGKCRKDALPMKF